MATVGLSTTRPTTGVRKIPDDIAEDRRPSYKTITLKMF